MEVSWCDLFYRCRDVVARELMFLLALLVGLQNCINSFELIAKIDIMGRATEAALPSWLC